MRLIILIIFGLFIKPLFSQELHSSTKSFGRLFSTPVERAALDRTRKTTKFGDDFKVDEANPAPAVEVPIREQFTLNGFVKRSSGKETTWINQVPQHEQKNLQNLKVNQQLSRLPLISVLLPTGRRVALKTGQTFDRTTGIIHEVYEQASNVVARPIK